MITHWIAILHISIIAIIWSEHSYGQTQDDPEASSNHYRPAQPSSEIAIPIRIISSPDNDREEQANTKAREEERRWNETNLTVQSSLADSSKKIVQYTSYQIWIAATSILFAFFTFGTAIFAVIFARRSSEAAHRSVDITRHFGEAQTRAYVYAKSAKVNWFIDGAQAVITIANCGETPAKSFTLSGTIDFQPLKSRPIIPPPTSGITWSSLGAKDSTAAPLNAEGIQLSDLDREQENYLSVRGTVKYTTIFDEVAFSEFAFMLKYRRDDKQTMQVAADKLRVFEIEQA